MALRLLTLTSLCATTLLTPAWADLQFSLDGRTADERAAEQRPRAKAPAKKKAGAKPTSPVAVVPRPSTPQPDRGLLASRGMVQQIGVARRGGPPILPPVEGTSIVPDAVIAAPAPSPAQVTVNARLGRMMAYQTDVYKLPDPRSQWVGKVSQGQQVAIVSQWEGWYAIVMGNGTQAYVPQTHVEVLPYQVKTVSPVAPTPSPTPMPTSGQTLLSPTGAPEASPAHIRALIQEAFKYEGTPYVYGGNGSSGIDCSGLVKNCFASLGVSLPRRASEQATVGASAPLAELQPGDRLYFSVKRQFDHTGIYLGNGYFIHASASRKKVAVDHLSTPLYGTHLEAARRF